ncbi:hypothetical protein RINGS_91 [Arthrobacter phage Rings]|uniref:Uncharacterized protein n=4 Tax=Amigovirus amigo TaxID=1982100 RepID=A0A0U4JDR8_9CAUD|nr:hypothetical protein ANANSI_2 [Arthrobacter phage Anansi]ALY09066.1 hypothetical protein GORGEOUS_2 [Arthrobacter phage Gorgeous]ALY10084.1 hypothetical protein RINGS_2 [Arthrobacter phage Rings]ALY10347.1 hypothetical protein SORJUANA_2 [Arthrobacter phage SorJuana]ALY08534.1 hypothetical protein ANANSI_91 [Arthrobacter phage Anansi]
MTRLLEPYRVEHTITVDSAGASRMFADTYVLGTVEGPNYFVRDIPFSVLRMLKAHGTLDVKVRRLENTQFIETILSIKKAAQ